MEGQFNIKSNNWNHYVLRIRSGQYESSPTRWESVAVQIRPNWLMFVMYFESRLNHRAVNRISGATGLIQFMPATARGLGTTTDALFNMSNVDQLYYVKKYLMPYRGKMKRWVDVYLAVFYPAALGNPNYVITRDVVAIQNPIFDINKDKDITVREIETVLRNKIPIKYRGYYE